MKTLNILSSTHLKWLDLSNLRQEDGFFKAEGGIIIGGASVETPREIFLGGDGLDDEGGGVRGTAREYGAVAAEGDDASGGGIADVVFSDDSWFRAIIFGIDGGGGSGWCPFFRPQRPLRPFGRH